MPDGFLNPERDIDDSEDNGSRTTDGQLLYRRR